MHREFESDAEIKRIAEGFADLTLPKAEWTHAAHFSTALWLLRQGEAARMPAMIRAYNESVGGVNNETSGYHETITIASLRAAAAHLNQAADAPLYNIANALLRGECGRSDWLLSYWSHPVLFSVEARRFWVEPDLKPLPFPELEVL